MNNALSELNRILKKTKNHIRDCEETTLSDSKIRQEHMYKNKIKHLKQLNDELEHMKTYTLSESNQKKVVDTEKALNTLTFYILQLHL